MGLFDSDRVDAPEYAYGRFDSPDAPLMILTYGATALLATAGGPDRPHNAPWLPVAQIAKTLYDSATTVSWPARSGRRTGPSAPTARRRRWPPSPRRRSPCRRRSGRAATPSAGETKPILGAGQGRLGYREGRWG